MEKLEQLEKGLGKLGRVLVAYSGGVDSTFLLAVARRTLGRENVLAVTAVSETYPAAELEQAKALAKEMDVQHVVLKTAELRNRTFRANPVNRCFYCKDELFGKLAKLAKRRKMVLCDANNHSDRGDYRPGRKAAEKWKVVSPLMDVELTKEEIRQLSRKMKLKTWSQPAQACLASRIPYGTAISAKELRRIEQGEEFLRQFGLGTFRLRSHGDVARLEVEKNKMKRLLFPDNCSKIVTRLKELGWKHVSVDMEGYRTGSLNP